MDLVTLASLYPIVNEIIKRAPQVKEWLERRARKDDPSLLLQLQLLESVSALDKRFDDSRRYSLMTSIMTAKLSNPDLEDSKFIEAAKYARNLVKALEDISP